jgi:hypothetical protein
MAMSRTLVLHLPAFRLERCGYEAEQVAAVTAEQKSAVRLVSLTPGARAAGLRVGMTATEARARQPDVLLEDHDPVGEDFDRQALLQVFAQFSDRVFPLFEEDFALGVEGTARLFGGEAALLAQVQALLEDLGHVCQGAVADDPLAAAALAGWGPGDAVARWRRCPSPPCGPRGPSPSPWPPWAWSGWGSGRGSTRPRWQGGSARKG